jgi:CotH kinase protein/Lamin Tail Domain/Chitobiase/beta-hexosaminidase C-terminal domain/Secretion system C-terminal sorting domain
MHRLKFSLLLVVGITSIQLNGQLLINEVMAVNESGLINPLTGEAGDWIEIYNGTDYAIDLSDYYLSDRLEDLRKWQFPSGTLLAPGTFQLVWADGNTNSNPGCHTNFKLDASGESLYLFKNSGTLHDSLRYPRMHADISFGISQDGSRLYFSNPTPGASNDSGSGFLYSAGVSITPPAGIYSSSIQVSMESGAPGIIRYTIDGSEPDVYDPMYIGPFSVFQNNVIRARLWQSGFEAGPVSTSSFIINNGFTMPVFSLTTDPENFWDDETGIYVEGSNGITGYCSDIPVNWNQDWERPLSFEFFTPDGERAIQQDVGTKIHGACSRTAPMKSLGLIARGRYGDSSMDYPFFSDKPGKDEYKGLILRNSGNDNQYTMFRDAMIQSVVWPIMDVDYQAYETVRVFLNGEFFGIYNLREKVNEHWITTNYGIDAEEIDFIKNGNEVYTGSITAFDSLQFFLENMSLADQENFDWVADRVDLDSYTDYLITQLFFANRDWPGNNQKCWKGHAPASKWRWILFDLDFTMGIYEFNPALDMFSFATANYTDEWPNPRWATLIIRRLLENEAYREQFIQKYLVHLNTTLNTERVHAKIDSFYNTYLDVVPEQMARWNRPWSMNSWNEHVNLLKTFASERPDHVRRNMRNFFNLGREISLDVDASDGTYKVSLNGVKIPVEGIQGSYLAGTSLDLNCSPEAGYRFSHWEISSGSSKLSMLIPALSTWSYQDTGEDPGPLWKEESFDDTDWAEGAGELGYGDGGETTVLDFGENSDLKHISYYFRKKFHIENPEQYQELFLRIKRDDGVVVYLNGSELLRDNMPAGEVLSSTLATSYVSDEQEETYMEFNVEASDLIEGSNILALEIHQNSPTSSDISFDLELQGMEITTGDTISNEERRLTLLPENDISVRAVTRVHEPELEAELYINELMASNQGAFTDPYGGDADWIELYNNGSKEMDLAGLYLTDDRDTPTKFQIPFDHPGETTIGARDFLVFYADQETGRGPLHTNFKLSSSGEFLGISTQSSNRVYWIDSLKYGIQEINVSTGRYPDGSKNWMTMAPHTPGESNLVTANGTLNQTSQAAQLDLFPNPVSERLNIRLSYTDKTSEKPARILLYDLTGKNCLEAEVDGWNNVYTGSINVSGLPAGIYLLVIEKGSERFSRKIIKVNR